MATHERKALEEQVDAAGADAFGDLSSPQIVFPSSRKSMANAGNVVQMDRKRDEQPDRPRATEPDENAEAEGGLSRADRTRMADQIGRQLRGMYDGLLSQPVPDRFMELVQRLERGGAKGENDK